MVLADLGRKLQGALRLLQTDNAIDEQVLDSILKEICVALMESDVNVKLVQQLRKNIKSIVNLKELGQGINKKRHIQKCIFNELCRLVDPGVEQWKPRKQKANVIMFVGLQGSGKTTTCTKLAAYYLRKRWKVCLVCTDTFRAGAYDQLKQNATKSRIPFYGSYTESDPVQLAMDGVAKFKAEGFEIIIVDTSGRHKQETELFEEMKQISNVVNPDNVVFVMDATIGQAADAQARAFKETVTIGSIVITKMDGHAKGGGAISAVAATGSPIIFIGTGEHVHDLDPFDAQKFIGKMLGMGDLSGLMETVQEMGLDENSGMIKNLAAGVFTLKDMRDQMQMISNMGPLSKIMSMMPGIPQELLQLSDKEGTPKIKKFMCMFDSMTEKELQSDGLMFSQQTSRIYRVARGSGSQVIEVEQMLSQCKMFAGMVKQIGGPNGMMKNMEKAGKKGNANPAQMQAQMQNSLQSMLPPGMMDQMGGMGGIQQMMEQMGGMNGIQQMMRQMGGAGGLGGLASMFGGGPSTQPGTQKQRKR